MTKTLEIENCLDCPKYCFFWERKAIPNGCPLPDKPEPITGEWLAGEFNNDFWEKLAERINRRGVKDDCL